MLAQLPTMPMSTSPPPVPVTAQRHMFTPESRRALLREVIRLKPYDNPAMWDTVTLRYGWWCYKNICPARRTVPKDRLRKKVKSIITSQYSLQSNSGASDNSIPRSASTSSLGSDLEGTALSTLTHSKTPSQAPLDEDFLPYDPETLDLIDQVAKQYTRSVEMVQAKRIDRTRKRNSDLGMPPPHMIHSPISSFKNSSSSELNTPSSLRYRPLLIPGTNEDLNSGGSLLPFHPHPIPLGITDMINPDSKKNKRLRLDPEILLHHQNDNSASAQMNSYIHNSTRDVLHSSNVTDDSTSHNLIHKNSMIGDSNASSSPNSNISLPDSQVKENTQSSSPDNKLKHSNSLEDILLEHSSSSPDIGFDPNQTNETQTENKINLTQSNVLSSNEISNLNSSSALLLTASMAEAASSAVLGKLPAVLQAVRQLSDESNRAQLEVMKSIGNTLGTTLGESLATTFASTVNAAIEKILQRIEESGNLPAAGSCTVNESN